MVRSQKSESARQWSCHPAVTEPSPSMPAFEVRPRGISKAATDKLTADVAVELRDHDVAVVSLYPGLVGTEAVLAAGVFDLNNSESPEFIGRADGRSPRPLTLTDV